MNVETTCHHPGRDNRSAARWGSGLLVLVILSAGLVVAQNQEKIVENVYVENVEIPVRVFAGSQPVSGLTRNNFELFIDGKKTKINGFYESRKKLKMNPSPDAPTGKTTDDSHPRLFVLMFNLSDFGQDLGHHLDILFEQIIRPGDHLVVMTNRYFFPEWKVEVPEKMKIKIRAILDKEVNRLRSEMLRFENELRAISNVLRSRLEDPREKEIDDTFPLKIFQDFFFTYQFILEDIKNQYLNLPLEQYIRISEYLKGQQMEKWVLCFYQMGRLPLLDNSGYIHKALERFMDKVESASYATVRQQLTASYLDLNSRIREMDDLFLKDIGKSFLDSGATVHTLILKPGRRSSIIDYNDYRYENVVTDSENILTQLSRLTGGSIVKSNKIQDFIMYISRNEDIVYTLTFSPDSRKKKPSRAEIKINNPHYRLVYDNQKRAKSFRILMNRLAQESQNIEIEAISFHDDMLKVKLSHIRLVQYEGESFGAVRARVKILDNRKKVIAGFEKTYKGIKQEGVFQAQLPPIASGRYKVVLEVKDLFSMKNVYAGDAVAFIKQ